jgi:isopenicillin N synthase-like dioxygenase
VNNFFHQPLEQKKKLLSRDRAKRGYAPLETENFASLIGEKKPNDICEKVRFGPAVDTDNPYYCSKQGRAHFAPNEWGDESELFRSAITEYYSAMENVTSKLLEIIAIGLGVSACYFGPKMTKHTSILSLNYYPPVAMDWTRQPHSSSTTAPGDIDEQSPGTFLVPLQRHHRIAEHTDVSMITIVNQSPPTAEVPEESWGGLEIKVGSGQWMQVPYIPGVCISCCHKYVAMGLMQLAGALVVNIGDCLRDWSGGRLQSTLHRVALPSPLQSPLTSPLPRDCTGHTGCIWSSDRVAVAFFASPNFDAGNYSSKGFRTLALSHDKLSLTNGGVLFMNQ